ncbi:cobyrinate a,c-diamide synthase [Rhodoblastus sp.]|uniref:cobyrinate a,c-diamide synthase n=1 Tax=Rhodoblastus sp. TaxID=1962975 RepID=UPI003F9E44CF
MTRLFVSAAAKSSGKTTITLGLAAALHARGLKVQTFKKGPDYIDPMWLARASGRASYNLDFNTQSPDEILGLYARAYGDADIALIEGNKGLHDGVDPYGADSSAALARLLRTPVVLIIDAHGMARGVAPLLIGYRDFDPDVAFAGVILNKVGPSRQEGKLRQAIENYTDLKVLGALGRDHGLNIDERHLGLTTPSEAGECDEVIGHAREAVSKGVDLDALLASSAREEQRPAPVLRALPAPDVTLAVARDPAFGFYYADDLEALQEAGARLVFVDMLRDSRLPPCDGLFIGGGFPETQSEALAANKSMRDSVRAAIEGGLPTYAECGGLMYLTRSISYRGAAEGSVQAMVGVIPADSVMDARPQGRGLVRVEPTADFPWPKAEAAPVAAHEFHYARLENVAPDLRYGWRVQRGYGVDGQRDGIVIGNLFASFTHRRTTSRDRWTDQFVAFVRQNRKRQAARSGAAAGKGLTGRRQAS